MNKLHSVLLIDDDKITNFVNEITVRNTEIAENIVITQSGDEALQYLREHMQDAPELIFLDINMPGMNGWEFINEYAKLKESLPRTKVIMLTTSQNPDDRKRASSIDEIAGFENKPLSQDVVKAITQQFFPYLRH